MLICRNCGEKENFYKDILGRETYTDRIFMDENAEEYDNDRTSNGEIVVEEGAIMCSECNEVAEEVSLGEYVNFDYDEAQKNYDKLHKKVKGWKKLK